MPLVHNTSPLIPSHCQVSPIRRAPSTTLEIVTPRSTARQGAVRWLAGQIVKSQHRGQHPCIGASERGSTQPAAPARWNSEARARRGRIDRSARATPAPHRRGREWPARRWQPLSVGAPRCMSEIGSPSVVTAHRHGKPVCCQKPAECGRMRWCSRPPTGLFLAGELARHNGRA